MNGTSPTKPFNLAIVGGGITGLTLAIVLLQHNVQFTVYEAASKFGEIGAGVGFGPNAIRAMSLISPLVQEAYQRCRTNQWESKQNVWFGARVGDMRKAGDDGTFEYAGRPGMKIGDEMFEIHYPNLEDISGVGGVHRAHFLDQLVHLIPSSVARFGKRLVDVSGATDGSEDVVLHFADGTTAQHTAVLGCDGIKSQTRKSLLGSDTWNAVFSGKCAYRGLVPMTKAIELLGEEKAMNSQIYFGYHGHILTFPIEKGKTMNVVAFASRESWTTPEWVVRVTKEELLADFRTWGPTAIAIISAMERHDVWALFDHPPAPTYYGTKPRICLVGDAAHATTPHQGSGAGMGIEDCYILGNLLGEADSVEDLDRAFKAYDEIRRPRTHKLVTTSKEAGRLWDFELEGHEDDVDALQRNMENRMHWIWNHDLRAELERARVIFRQPA
ncbi:mannitol 1-phosphate dehydrogenase 2 [Xylaria bambusicola]|uniref:mannitol 1-phosphate dehydrogenase 2 n=1 Tax=Xylaria bambusicola TaxID=326684 RepID=UPI002007C96C|nr:mannitol 1-phosphate dehydrogenase 2 [Xylaria bambusicola]KAI0521937.1 mannitol 1-phosphate dehydrogenase 2 [Xylaria bambusicola]